METLLTNFENFIGNNGMEKILGFAAAVIWANFFATVFLA
jgi:hypothetical protein